MEQAVDIILEQAEEVYKIAKNPQIVIQTEIPYVEGLVILNLLRRRCKAVKLIGMNGKSVFGLILNK